MRPHTSPPRQSADLARPRAAIDVDCEVAREQDLEPFLRLSFTSAYLTDRERVGDPVQREPRELAAGSGGECSVGREASEWRRGTSAKKRGRRLRAQLADLKMHPPARRLVMDVGDFPLTQRRA